MKLGCKLRLFVNYFPLGFAIELILLYGGNLGVTITKSSMWSWMMKKESKKGA